MTQQVKDLESLLDDDVSAGGIRTHRWVGGTRPGRRRKVLVVGGASTVAAIIVALALSTTGTTGTSHHGAVNSVSSPLSAGVGSTKSAAATGGVEASNAFQSAGAGSGASTGLAGAGTTSSGVSALPNEVPALSSKVVKTGTLQLQVASGSIPAAVARLSSEASGLSGFVASSSESTGTSASGDVTLRVPVANYDALVGDAQRLGKTLQLTSSGQDVTAQYVDLQARIQSLQTARTQFEQILAKAQSIGDILAVESQISDLQTQVEQLQGQFQVLDDQATYSTLAVQISEAGKPLPAPPKPASGVSKAWSHARHSFSHGVESILSATGGIALFLVTVAAVLLIGRIIWVGVRRRIITEKTGSLPR